MELSLNLLWLLLVMAAFWIWRRQGGSLGSWRCLLALACSAFLLFPVVSATDDLQAIRPEMVESGPLKTVLKQGTSAKSTGQSQFPKSPAILTVIFAVRPSVMFWAQLGAQPFFSRFFLKTRVLPTRAPPFSFLA